jgi:hypothetical protein
LRCHPCSYARASGDQSADNRTGEAKPFLVHAPTKERRDRLRASANHNHDDRKKVNDKEEYQEMPIAFHLGNSPDHRASCQQRAAAPPPSRLLSA